MSLPYDLYVSLLLQSLILDPFHIPNGPDDFGMGYMAGEEVEVERDCRYYNRWQHHFASS